MPPNEVDQCTAKAQKALFVVEYNQGHSKHQIFTLCVDSSQCQLENRWRVSRGHFQYIFYVLSVVACVAEPWFIPRSPFVDFEKRSTYNIYMLWMWSMRQAHVCVTVGWIILLHSQRFARTRSSAVRLTVDSVERLLLAINITSFELSNYFVVTSPIGRCRARLPLGSPHLRCFVFYHQWYIRACILCSL